MAMRAPKLLRHNLKVVKGTAKDESRRLANIISKSSEHSLTVFQLKIRQQDMANRNELIFLSRCIASQYMTKSIKYTRPFHLGTSMVVNVMLDNVGWHEDYLAL